MSDTKPIAMKQSKPKTPAAFGYSHPAEWQPHDATWLTWPHNASDWPGKFQTVPWVYGEIIRKLAPGEAINLVVDSPKRRDAAKRVLSKCGVNLSAIQFHTIKTNRGWNRDAGPIFVKRDSKNGPLAVVNFQFNAWAKYPDYQLDNQVAKQAASKMKVPCFEPSVNGKPLVLEGGAIDVNGAGDLITTEECLLDSDIQARNPRLSKPEVEQALRDYLGAERIHWLGKGIAGDDTHGHVDDLCRFVNEDTIVIAQEENPNDENYAWLKENRERLQSMRVCGDETIEVIELPMPQPLIFDGQRLPASYANFYIANAAVLVPTFNDPSDYIAVGILRELFNDRDVVGINCTDLIWGLGAIHCLTHEQPGVG